MSPCKKREQKAFKQRLEFRRGDTDSDSTIDVSKSSSRSDPAPKMRKLVSSSVSQVKPVANGQIKHGTVNRVHVQRSIKDNVADKEVERDTHRNDIRKKSETIYDSAALDDFKIYTESLLEDLRVTQDNLFTWMRDEMQKIVTDETTTKPKRRGDRKRRNNFDGNTLVQLERKSETNVRLQHQKNLEVHFYEQKKHLSEENIQFQHKGEDSIQVDNRLRIFSGTIQVHHKNHSEENIQLLNQNYFGESIQMKCKNRFEQDIQKLNRDEIKIGMKRQNVSGGSFERVPESKVAGIAIQNVESTKSMMSIEKNKNERLSSSVEKNFQSGIAIPNVQHQCQRNFVLGTTAEKGNDGSLERFINHGLSNSNDCFKVLEKPLSHGQAIRSMASTASDKEELGLSVNPYVSSSFSGQEASSMYLTLPTVITEPFVENPMLGTSDNGVQPGGSRNKRGVDSEKVNLVLDSSTNCGYYPGMQQGERIRNYAHPSSRIMQCLDQNSPSMSCLGTGCLVPVHQVMDSGFYSSNQSALDNQVRGNNNVVGLRMNGGAIRISEGYNLSEQYVASSFCINSDSKAYR
ncbi:Ankyrin repeat, PH and SEC7 domain containing protein [Quillaja saponaria]|uniref:Ankyrin repeat, PH and SEC7 domain containing protein n=1 Tax=Quillaja saponaria TaxID=32244 RepID=A0AAD7L675_QUISA|nr:Ankyrin repeat, PH and SEC7 domain containing protein [Quillaja saponaria]